MLNKTLMESAGRALKDMKGAAIILFIDAVDDWGFWKESKAKESLILVTRSQETARELSDLGAEVKAVLSLPGVKLSRLGQIKLSIITAITEGVIASSDRIICLTGVAGSGTIDTLMALDLGEEKETFATKDVSRDLLARIKPEVLETVLGIALELATEGREGRSIGTTFVIGDDEKVMKLSRPLILNPFKGYPEESRNILSAEMHETIKEFSLLDGAFVIREDGVVLAAGVHLDAALDENGHTPGLGSRHMAAAGITDVTDAAAITVSGSTGMVRIFRKGKTLLEIERPRVEDRRESKPL